MSLNLTLLEQGHPEILNYVKHKPVKLSNSELIYNYIRDIVDNNRRVLLYGDYDTDGVTCIINWKMAFHMLGFNNYDVFQYRERTHKLDSMAVHQAISGGYDYFIVNDTASSEMSKINVVVEEGIKMIIVDHHETTYNYEDYPEGCAIVNSIIENRLLKEDRYKTSAGALSYLLLDRYLYLLGMETDQMCCIALASLYADCMDMNNEINRGIYYKARGTKPERLPNYIKDFMKPYDFFSRRFIEFNWTPKINSLFRNEKFEYLNMYITQRGLNPKLTTNGLKAIIDTISQIHYDASMLCDKIIDIVEYKELDNFVLANLNSVQDYLDVRENKIYNYTGLVANRLTDRFQKPAIVYCANNEDIKGSFRDLRGRDYLTVFKVFCEAGGHNPAFGMHINKFDFSDWISTIKLLDKSIENMEVKNQQLEIEHKYDTPDGNLINTLAKYNEFAGQTVPYAVITKLCTISFQEVHYPYNGYKYIWGHFTIKSSTRLKKGEVYKLRPTLQGQTILYVV